MKRVRIPSAVLVTYPSEIRAQVLSMREGGLSIREIERRSGVPRGTVSIWTRPLGIRLPQKYENCGRLGAEGRRKRADADRTEARKEAEVLWEQKKEDPRFLFGLALYIGEGNKTGATPGISNCDARVMKSAIRFFESLGVLREEFAVSVGVHTEDQVRSAETFWSKELGFPSSQFRKTTVSSPASDLEKNHKQPFGTCQIRTRGEGKGRRLMSIIERLSDLALGEAPLQRRSVER